MKRCECIKFSNENELKFFMFVSVSDDVLRSNGWKLTHMKKADLSEVGA